MPDFDLGINAVIDSDEYLFIRIKFGGYWETVKNQSRKKYSGRKQRTL